MSFGFSGYVPIVLYVGAIAALLLSIFWRPIVGIFYLLPLIPLQTVRYSMNTYPLAEHVIPIMLLAVALGLLRNGEAVLPKTPMRGILLVYGLYTVVSLVYGSFSIHAPWPLPGDDRFGVWEDYMDMPALLLLVTAVAPTRKQIKAMLLVLCVAVLAMDRSYWSSVSGRDFSYYTDDLRSGGGAMGYAGINGLAAFEAMFSTFLIALACYERRRLLKLAYYALSGFGVACLMYTFSRGAYLAFLLGWLMIGILKNRFLLVLLIVFGLGWTAFVPPAVQQRVSMTYNSEDQDLDHSSDMRLWIWADAISLFESKDVVFGMGFDTYRYLHRVGNYESAHNIILNVLVETGFVGLILFLWLIWKFFWSSYRLSRMTEDPFIASIALGIACSVACALLSSLFGDRWLYFQVNGYMWVFGGIVMAEWIRMERGESVLETDAEDVGGILESPLEA